MAPIDCAPAPPNQKLFMPGYVNNATVSDVTFLVRLLALYKPTYAQAVWHSFCIPDACAVACFRGNYLAAPT